MKNSEKKWLESATWENVIKVYQACCQAQKLDPLLNKSTVDKARQYWESQAGKTLSLPQALEVCQKCYGMSPFIFNNGNTFATVAKQLVESWAKSLPSVEGRMLQITAGHFVTGKVSRRELLRTLDFLAPSWQHFQLASTMVTLQQPQAPPEAAPEPPRDAQTQPAHAPVRQLVAS